MPPRNPYHIPLERPEVVVSVYRDEKDRWVVYVRGLGDVVEVSETGEGCDVRSAWASSRFDRPRISIER